MSKAMQIEEKEKEKEIVIPKTRRTLVDETYEFVPKNPIYKFFSNGLYYGIAYPILSIVLKIVYDFKIEGKEHIKEIESGMITVSNHVLILDCAMIGIALGRKKVYFTTQEENFQIPFIRKLIKLLNAIPIPKGIHGRKKFIEEITTVLQNQKVVQFYPEAYLQPYCTQIRNFKNGCFDIAVKNQIPILPMVFTFREPKGIRKYVKRKKDVTLKIGSCIFPEQGETVKEAVEKLKQKVHKEMEAMLPKEIGEKDV